jgi:carboxyl-terminal processing protease
MLDLRYCSLGPIEEGIAVSNLFMDKGLITYSQGQKVARLDHSAVASKAVTKLPLVVLVNRGTAGAAEVAAGALLDSKRAQVVGDLLRGRSDPQSHHHGRRRSRVLSVAKYYLLAESHPGRSRS